MNSKKYNNNSKIEKAIFKKKKEKSSFYNQNTNKS